MTWSKNWKNTIERVFYQYATYTVSICVCYRKVQATSLKPWKRWKPTKQNVGDDSGRPYVDLQAVSATTTQLNKKVQNSVYHYRDGHGLGPSTAWVGLNFWRLLLVGENLGYVQWHSNRLQLNCDKTDFAWLTTNRSLHRLPTMGPTIGSVAVVPSQSIYISDLGVYIDADLTMRAQVQRIASRGVAVLRRLRSIRRYVPTSVFRSL